MIWSIASEKRAFLGMRSNSGSLKLLEALEKREVKKRLAANLNGRKITARVLQRRCQSPIPGPRVKPRARPQRMMRPARKRIHSSENDSKTIGTLNSNSKGGSSHAKTHYVCLVKEHAMPADRSSRCAKPPITRRRGNRAVSPERYFSARSTQTGRRVN